MRTFLSHSSKDKAFVRQVADILGEGQCEYDERSFEHVMNARAIRNALDRSDIYVFFVSGKSLKSPFVDDEQRVAMEKRASGMMRRVLVISLDDTSYRELPDWLREINVVQKLSSPKICARKIQATLVRLEAEEDSGSEIYLGREAEDASLSKALSGAPSKTPIALHLVGHYGIGRKTILKRNLHKLFPRRFDTFPEITIASNQGIEELYRQILDLTSSLSLADTISEIDQFSKLQIDDQASSVAKMIESMLGAGEFIVATDDGGVYTEDGDFQPHLRAVLEKIDGRGLPAIGFIQTRMMPTRLKAQNPRSYHQYISALSDESTRQLFGLLLKQLGVNYTDEQVSSACEMFDGHPFNVRFAAVYAHDYGLDLLIADPSELVDWKRRRAEDFLRSMTFTDIEGDILAALDEYRYLATEMLFSALPHTLPEAASALRRLQEFSCVERRENYSHIAPPLRDAIRRDKRFDRGDAWKRDLGRCMCESISEYRDDDQVSISILDGAALAAARGNVAPQFISAVILPSHLLRIARDYYDEGNRARCIEFCERAWSSKQRLPEEGQLEILRLWGLSSVRVNDDDDYNDVLKLLASYSGRTAERISLFLQGFHARIHKKADVAEAKFMAAWRLSRENQSVNRELASLLSKQRRYDEAERFARGAYEKAPTNPYLIDVMAEVLLGKWQQGLHVDRKELDRVMADLARYGDAPGSSFFLVRKAQAELAAHEYQAALRTSDRAVERTPALASAYFIRADARLALRDHKGAEDDAEAIEKLLTKAGGFSEGEEARLQELQIRILIEKGQLRQAKQKVEVSAWLGHKVSQRLLGLIERAVLFNPTAADEDLRSWATRRAAKNNTPRR